MRPKWIFVSVIATAVLLASATSVFANHAWSKYHWEITEAPLSLNLGDNLGSNWSSYLATANANWNDLTPALNNAVVAGAATGDCSAATGAVEICADAYGATGWLGIAGISVKRGKDGHITRGYVKLNDSYYDATTPGTGYNTADHRLFVVCQEVGHIFGLGHQDENFDNANLDSCMDYTGTMTAAQSTPNAHDAEQLESIYAHVHGGEKVKGGGGGNNGGGRGKPSGQGVVSSEWGQAIHSDSQGRPDTFQRELPNGNLEITHVTWAD
jgi:hypothetical protein